MDSTGCFAVCFFFFRIENIPLTGGRREAHTIQEAHKACMVQEVYFLKLHKN